MITVVGSINMDIVVQMKEFAQADETVLADSISCIPGGKSLNQAIAARRLGAESRLVGCIGDDVFGQQVIGFLQEQQINIEQIETIPDVSTGVVIIELDAQGHNRNAFIYGANYELHPDSIDKIVIQKNDIIVSCLDIPKDTVRKLFTKAKNTGAKTILNATRRASLDSGLNRLIDYIIVNEVELATHARRDITKELTSVFEAMMNIRNRQEQTIIATLGNRGVVFSKGEKLTHVPAQEVNVVDTTGAGDCFIGSFAVALSEGRDIQTAVEFGNLAAAISVQRLGASSSLPIRAEVDALEQELLEISENINFS